MTRAVLALNAGSSSLKFALFAIEKGDTASSPSRRIASGELEGIGSHPHFVAHDATGGVLVDETWAPVPPGTPAEQAQHGPMATLMAWVGKQLGDVDLMAVGHRVVHGGPDFIAPVRITPGVLARLAALTPFAPLHQPGSLAPVRALLAQYPDLPQVACFDTGFHHTLPAVAQAQALPGDYAARGVRRYGFHGLSYEYIATCLRARAPHLAQGRAIVAHIGSGGSLCALQAGRSVDTTMGFSVLDGLVMGTRCGHLDPGVILYMLREEGLGVAEIENILYHRSGLLGVSGLSADMRDLHAHAGTSPAVTQALDLFVYRFAQQAGGMMAALQGLDGLVFTAGIGEHDATIRAAVCARLEWAGIRIDAQANAAHREIISTPHSAVEVRVIPTDEETTIRRHVLMCLG
ncbi:acetate/propionate family kinase [Komagataeibacter rhaeticus]|uniref:Acetate kinase n=1 Tax=Komagataeibacter rhaeticus TaxID=215221 RepID=A0A181CE45_9PROT|nr:acetate/propionate family kinase [Komagataeibacter rhaeticus]ATU74506.1 acetate/propionate family kinase [Komagataeibacter xylinus]QIP36486.1 acetate/propionate family kinase [Komagataeibacter rhaeticus]QOC46257.1 acetate/propionate family kinase [Komagataeibacter rhaeticus]WPP21086.1 acetate/propionate family kinase [Komagataeibacter rhaeticus]SAY49851.1 Acetate kinase [Komagataeibacter rhaeticus]